MGVRNKGLRAPLAPPPSSDFQRVIRWSGGIAIVAALSTSVTASAANDLATVVDKTQGWVAGIVFALATLFLTIGGVKYLIAGGNQRLVEEAKQSIRSALAGYVIAILAPVLAGIVKSVVGG